MDTSLASRTTAITWRLEMIVRNFNFCAVALMLLLIGYTATGSNLRRATESQHKETRQSTCANHQELRLIVQQFSSKRDCLIDFGPLAIPKLSAALRQNPDRNYRLNAVFCIAQIGGGKAISALRNSLSSESDSCVRKFMQVSIDALNNPRAPGEITGSDRDKWFSAFNCVGVNEKPD